MACHVIRVGPLARAPVLSLALSGCHRAIGFSPLRISIYHTCVPELLLGPVIDRDEVLVLFRCWPYWEGPRSDRGGYLASGLTALRAVVHE